MFTKYAVAYCAKKFNSSQTLISKLYDSRVVADAAVIVQADECPNLHFFVIEINFPDMENALPIAKGEIQEEVTA